MHPFESLVADILRSEGYWVQTNFGVFLTKEDKAVISRPSCPNWELDILAYSPASNRLKVVECKSYLDSGGVQSAMFDPKHKLAGRFKLFNDSVLREVVFGRLLEQVQRMGLCPPGVLLELALVCGHVTDSNEARLTEIFGSNGWELLGPSWLRHHFEKMAVGGYQNNANAMIVKLALNSKPALDLPEDHPQGWRAEAREELFADQLRSGEFEIPRK